MRRRLLTFLLCCFLAGCGGGSGSQSAPASTTTTVTTPLSNSSLLRKNGIGPIKFGETTVDQARLLTGQRILEDALVGSPPEYCKAVPVDVLTLQFFLGDGGKIIGASISAGSAVKTSEGIGIGSTVDQVKRAYPAAEEKGDSKNLDQRLVTRGNDGPMKMFISDNKVTNLWVGQGVADAEEVCG